MTVTTSVLRDRLRGYQRQEVDFLVGRRAGRGILGSEQGTGKTPSALVAAHELLEGQGGFLVLCPKIAMGVWQEHIAEWWGRPVVFYDGTPKQRDKIDIHPPAIVVCPYSKAGELFKRRANWPLIIHDEAHWLRNRSAKTLYPVVKRFRSKYLFELTGTPIVKDATDMWTLLNMVDPLQFPHFWPFTQEHFYNFDGTWGGVLVGQAKDREKLRALFKQYMVRHKKADVLTELPPKIRQRLRVEMTPKQRRAYEQMAEEMIIAWESGDMLLAPTHIAKTMRLRQLLVTPALVGGPHSSGAFEALHDALANEFEAGRSCIVFTAFTQAIPLIADVFRQLKATVGEVHGQMSHNRITQTVHDFQHDESERKGLVCQIMSSASWTATKAATAFFLGWDWTPANNFQAEDRLHRMGQRDTVHAYYFAHRGTVEDHIREINEGKITWGQLADDPRDMLLPEAERARFERTDVGRAIA